MTLEELYSKIGGDYKQATNVLRIDKLIDKHIRKFPTNGLTEALMEAGKTMDATKLFEASHALKGVCSNLGLVKLAEVASVISDEFRPGNERKLSDSEVAEKIGEIEEMYKKATEYISQYE